VYLLIYIQISSVLAEENQDKQKMIKGQHQNIKKYCLLQRILAASHLRSSNKTLALFKHF
jgi:hypothetical protein